ncbi:MAG: BrxA/BrxB family bacilliredoxin [Flavobacteriales bacterium]|nr:BrxA/BrxB family bacilliredoxin [Flavobacteriales bacterium]NNK80662.1 BrxA/BrxB family bacilliredoxin [Flavobacteriales bacterium]
MYPAEIVNPMKSELTEVGFKEVTTPEEVDALMEESKGKTALVVINSVCGCAAGSMRPGVKASLQNDRLPDILATSFAGFDGDAVSRVRQYLLPYPPSSPSIGVFKNGSLVHMVERHHIEGRSAEMISEHLKAVYNEYC